MVQGGHDGTDQRQPADDNGQRQARNHETGEDRPGQILDRRREQAGEQSDAAGDSSQGQKPFQDDQQDA